MNKLLKRFLAKKAGFKKLKRIFKGSAKDPSLYLGVISAILFFLVSLGVGPLATPFSSGQGSFSLAAVSKVFGDSSAGDVFIGPTKKFWQESPELILVEGVSLKSASPPNVFSPRVLGALLNGDSLEDSKKTIIEYTVEPGESLLSVADRFNISLETLVWANNLKSLTVQPGQTLLVLPVSGVMHLVKEGDTINELAKEYKADVEKLLSFNDISGDSEIFSGEVLIIPDGRPPLISIIRASAKDEDTAAASLTVKSPDSVLPVAPTNNFQGKSAVYPYGQCTWWVSQKRQIPNWGNAKDWLDNAAASGVPICKGSYCVPQVGAVIALMGNRTYGHVGYVEELKGDKVVFSEMNYIGLGKMNYRSLRIGSSVINGYIY